MTEALPDEPFGDVVEKTRDLINRQALFILERDGTPLSMAHWTRDLGTSCAVTGVFTPQRLRGRGYGSLITACLTEMLLQRGRSETSLVANADNLTSNHIYRAIGYEYAGDTIDVKVSWQANSDRGS